MGLDGKLKKQKNTQNQLSLLRIWETHEGWQQNKQAQVFVVGCSKRGGKRLIMVHSYLTLNTPIYPTSFCPLPPLSCVFCRQACRIVQYRPVRVKGYWVEYFVEDQNCASNWIDSWYLISYIIQPLNNLIFFKKGDKIIASSPPPPLNLNKRLFTHVRDRSLARANHSCANSGQASASDGSL